MQNQSISALSLLLFLSLGLSLNGASAQVHDQKELKPQGFPSSIRCTGFSNTLEFYRQDGKWWAQNSNHFSNSSRQFVASPIEVKVIPGRFPGQYLISALDPAIAIATSSPRDEGDVPFNELTITTSPDPIARPYLGQFSRHQTFVTYACCPKPLAPPVRGQGFCQ